MQTVAPAFYRLEVHSFTRGLAVEERADLADVLALAAELLAGPPRIVTADATRVTLDGTTRDGEDVRLVIGYYALTAAPEDINARLGELYRADLDAAVWRTVVPDREPEDVAAALRSWGVLGALDGAHALVREADPANIARTAGLAPLAPDGGPLEADVLTWALASTLRRAGMPLAAEGAERRAPEVRDSPEATDTAAFENAHARRHGRNTERGNE